MALCCLSLFTANMHAFDFKSLAGKIVGGSDKSTVNNILNAVVGTSDIEVKDLVGTWNYVSPAVAFESEDMLSKAGGVAVASTIEEKIAPYFRKVGLADMSFTFTEEGEFTLKLKKGSLQGTVVKGDDGKFKFEFKALGKIKAFSAEAYVKKGATLEITFNVTKLMEIVKAVAKFSGSSTASSVVSLMNNYNGLYAGFELKQ